jgi:hypothetical protein
MEVPAPPGSSPSKGCFRRSCATTVGSKALSTPRPKGGELRCRFVECPSADELQELGGVSGGAAAFGLCLRLRITLCSALRAACRPEPVHPQALYEPHLLAVSPLLQPSGYQASPPPPPVARLYRARTSLLVLRA